MGSQYDRDQTESLKILVREAKSTGRIARWTLVVAALTLLVSLILLNN